MTQSSETELKKERLDIMVLNLYLSQKIVTYKLCEECQ